MIEIDESFEVRASTEVLWQVITDFDRYPEWNPFVVSCESSLRKGEPIVMKVQLFKAFAQPQREEILEVVPGSSLRYGLPQGALGALTSCRSHELTALDTHLSRYRSHFELRGWAAGLTDLLMGRALRRGFHAMSEALVLRAESLAP